jgi:hypothetical protein
MSFVTTQPAKPVGGGRFLPSRQHGYRGLSRVWISRAGPEL